MKIEVKERGPREYYDEFLFILLYYKKFIKNPHSKPHGLIKTIIRYEIVLLLCVSIIIFLYIKYHEVTEMFLIGVLTFCLIYDLYCIYIYNKRINQLMSDNDTKIIEINKEGIEYNDDTKSFRLEWSNTKYFLINKNTICFLPTEPTKPLISMTPQYKEEVINALKQYQKEDLIIDNTK